MISASNAFEKTSAAKGSRTLTVQECAEILHKCSNTVRKLMRKSIQNKKDGCPSPDDFPCAQIEEHGKYTIYETNFVEWGKRKGFF